jgi:hypothetical protein
MKLDNYKNIKKSEWQEIATQLEIQWDENSVVRYLVEKIAEKIGVDDKIVSDNELKKKVVEKLNLDYELVPIDESPIEEPVNKQVVEEQVVEEQAIEEQAIEEQAIEEQAIEEQVVEEDTKKVLSRIDELRLECESYGVAWTEKHTEKNLEQVLTGLKSAGVKPLYHSNSSLNTDFSNTTNTTTSTSISNSSTSTSTIDLNKPFEINSSNVETISNSISNIPNTSTSSNDVILNGGYTNPNSYLRTYQDIYLSAIRNHFRLLSINEIIEMINRDNQSFTFEIKQHPQQSNKIEIILKQGVESARIPSNNNEWIDING